MRDSKELRELIDSEPPREEGKHRFMGGTCVDCGHPLDEVCTANLAVPVCPNCGEPYEWDKALQLFVHDDPCTNTRPSPR